VKIATPLVEKGISIYKDYDGIIGHFVSSCKNFLINLGTFSTTVLHVYIANAHMVYNVKVTFYFVDV